MSLDRVNLMSLLQLRHLSTLRFTPVLELGLSNAHHSVCPVQLEAVGKLPSLTCLSLGRSIDARLLALLCRMLSALPLLEIEDEFDADIEDILPLAPSLRMLRLGGRQITPAAAQLLSRFTQLHTLDLARIPLLASASAEFDNALVQSLASMPELTSLKLARWRLSLLPSLLRSVPLLRQLTFQTLHGPEGSWSCLSMVPFLEQLHCACVLDVPLDPLVSALDDRSITPSMRDVHFGFNLRSVEWTVERCEDAKSRLSQRLQRCVFARILCF
jgi:hypothetical protein